MKYRIEVCDWENDKLIVEEVEAENVFDAIGAVETHLDNLENMFLNLAEPIS